MKEVGCFTLGRRKRRTPTPTPLDHSFRLRARGEPLDPSVLDVRLFNRSLRRRPSLLDEIRHVVKRERGNDLRKDSSESKLPKYLKHVTQRITPGGV